MLLASIFFPYWILSQYSDFDTLRARTLRACDTRSNLDKVKAICPLGGTGGIPQWVLDNQGGELHGLVCVGGFIGAATPAGDEFSRRELRSALVDRLSPLDEVDQMCDDSRRIRLLANPQITLRP